MLRPLLSLLSLVGMEAFACLNMVQRVPGVQQEHVEFYRLGDLAVDVDSVKAFVQFHDERCAVSRSRDCNDLVIAHLFLMQFDAALSISKQLVARFPEDYNVVITHAAVLELNGKAADAIPFMERAITLNPKSHKDSEWIHLNLLKQRVASTMDPWALIGVDLRPDSLPVAPDRNDLRELAKQVHYQVNDRLYFEAKPDPLFGALVFAYADLLLLTGHKSRAGDMYALAVEYGYDHTLIGVPPPTAESQQVVAGPEPTTKEPPITKEGPADNRWLSWAFIIAVALGVTVWFWRVARKG